MKAIAKYFIGLFAYFFHPKFLLKLSGLKGIHVFHHVVSDENINYIQPLYAYKNTSDFKRDISFLKKYFNIVSISDFLQHQNELNNFCTISFDDGLSQCYTTVFPILYDTKTPFCVFLNSKFVDNKQLFFRFKVALLIKKLNENAELQSIYFNFFATKNIPETENKIWAFRYQDIDLIDSLAEKTSLNFDLFLKDVKPYLTRQQIIEMKQAGVAFGGHSIDHPEFRFISFDEQIKQTVESINFTQQFENNGRFFAFPFTDFGLSKQTIEVLIDKARIDVCFGCAGLRLEHNSKHFQRIGLENPKYSARFIVNQALVYAFLLRFVQKLYISR